MGGLDPGAEFDRQLRVLLDRDYPRMAGVPAEEFADRLTPLRELAVRRCASAEPPAEGHAPFLLVISPDWAPAEQAMQRTELAGRAGFADFEPQDIARFRPVDGLDVPAGPGYLLFDVDRGSDLCNVTPDDAFVTITGRGRTPITVAEGIAFITQYPSALRKNHCFSLIGSRCGDRRVPALWISKRAPKLGWCWAGNPHTWLGSASCAGRLS